jgi:signal transduction histidine kinase
MDRQAFRLDDILRCGGGYGNYRRGVLAGGASGAGVGSIKFAGSHLTACLSLAKYGGLDAMIGKLKPLALFLFLTGVVAASSASQIAPSPYAATPPSAPTADQNSAETTAATPHDPAARILGWSLTSEIDPATIHHDQAVRLEAGSRDLIIFFESVPHPAADIEYRYQLAGYDADWTISQNRIAHYRRITPGRYRFQVQARRAGEAWASAAAQLSVEQRPFFYQTWYFYLLLALGLVLLAAQLLNQRDQLLKGQMGIVLEERNRIASDCHDTLMAGFAAISWQLEATAKLFRDADAAATPAATSCELARSMVAHCQAEARRIIWDLRDSDELTDILSQALSRSLSAHPLRENVSTTFDVEGEEIPIAPGAVHHLVCIGQEAVTNAMRHANPSKIVVGLRYDSDSLSLTIRDNGRGFQLSDTAARTGHFGIPVMQERARKLGGTLRLSSSTYSGTEVAVTVGFQTINKAAKQQQQHVVQWIGV